MGGKTLFPNHGPRKEPTNTIPSSPTLAFRAVSAPILAQAVPVYTEPPCYRPTEAEKLEAQRRLLETEWYTKQPSRRRRSKSAIVKNVERNGSLADEFNSMSVGLEEFRRYTVALPTVRAPFNALVSSIRKFKKSLMEELSKGNMKLVTSWELEMEMTNCRYAYHELQRDIQAALRQVVREFFVVRGPVLGEPTEYERRQTFVQESFWVLNDLKATFPEAVEGFGKQARAGPADGGGCAAPANSGADMLLDFVVGGRAQQPPRPPKWPAPTQRLISYTIPNSTQSTPSTTPSRNPQKRNRAESEEPQDLAVCVKRTKVDERQQSRPIARADDEEWQIVDLTCKEPKARGSCWS
ncbi:hypothetical protein QBC32DRAFT_94631 [Pseudoneurospora amorphoporcata]|uniref:Uncharacterized protein n=1 Tax=Pseudoneurospora amorphoporcata TaxID=241081 RepID=A0AAN6P0A0_9PEZI|nr:hypothetical protein QBC32DRAFT_94631 [Pseudoneurospora amorphoporcata]